MLKRAASVVVSLGVVLALAGVLGAERAEAAVPVKCGGKVPTMVGTNGANVLVGTKHADVIYARGGNDRIRGRGGKDVICAGPGNDYVDGGARHDVDRGQAGHDSCVSSPDGGVDKFVSCEDRTAFDLQMDDALDWGFVTDAAEHDPLPGENIVTTLRMGAGGVGHSGYRRTLVASHGLASGTTTVLNFGTELDDGQVTVPLPFKMPFFGIRYQNLSVSTNGWVGFGTPAWDYVEDAQFIDYRGFNQTVGSFYRGMMPFWSDLNLVDGGTGAGSVSVVEIDAHSVAIQWNAGECCDGEPPHRVFQLVLFDDGRFRYDYVSSTPPDDSPQPGFVGLSSGSGAAGVDTVRRSPHTFLRQDVTLPQATIPVRSTKGFKLSKDIFVASFQVVTCTGKTPRAFTGCTGGSGTRLAADHVRVHQPIDILGKSVLFKPFVSPSPRAPAGKVTFTLPAGSSFVDSSVPCSVAQAPTASKAGLLRCATPALGQGGSFVARVTWTVPPAIGNGQPSPPNVETKAVYLPAKAPRSVDGEEGRFAGVAREHSSMLPELTLTGPAPHVADPLTLHAAPHPHGSDALAFPVVEIRVPAHMHLNSTGIPHCGASLAGFGGGTVACRLPNGIRDLFSADLKFHTNAAGTYHPRVTFFADNAPTAAKTATVSVLPH